MLGGKAGAGRRPHIRVVAKPLGGRDILNICGFVVVAVLIMTIKVYYYYFKRVH